MPLFLISSYICQSTTSYCKFFNLPFFGSALIMFSVLNYFIFLYATLEISGDSFHMKWLILDYVFHCDFVDFSLVVHCRFENFLPASVQE